jgi:uncharacterized protein (TIGR02001 family)
MRHGSYFAQTLKPVIVSATLIAGVTTQACAGDPPKLEFSGVAVFTTDYMFRSVSNTSQNPAVQPEFDLKYGIFNAGIWGSNTDYGEGIEIDYYAYITPSFWGIDFEIGGFEYTYPGSNDIDYFELKTGASHAFDKLTLGVNNWWSPDWAGVGTQSDAIELTGEYKFAGKLWNFFSPKISGKVGWQLYEKEELVPNYTYWDVGLILSFLDKWEADIRYYDTDYSKTGCAINSAGRDNCDARVVGAIKASF